jgi:hypothetical protein
MKAENAGKDKKMKNLFAVTVALALLVVWAAPVAAQPAMRVDIPFAFTAGNQSLPAGEYRFTIDHDRMLTTIAPLDGSDVHLVRLVPGASERKSTAVEKGLLRFEKYGERYVLSEIWRPGSTAGKTVTGKRPPRELANAKVIRDVPATQ